MSDSNTEETNNGSNIAAVESTPLLTSKFQIKSGSSELPLQSSDSSNDIDGFFIEAKDTLGLAVPIFLARVSFIGVSGNQIEPKLHIFLVNMAALDESDRYGTLGTCIFRGP